jgi:hypothetical protein
MRCGRIGPRIIKRLEARASLANRIERVEEIARRSGEAIQLADHQRIAFTQRRDCLG